MLLEILLSIFDCTFLHGFLKNNVYPEKLSDEEEEKYLTLLFNPLYHDEARKELIIHNFRLVAHISKKYESKDENGKPSLRFPRFKRLRHDKDPNDISYD